MRFSSDLLTRLGRSTPAVESDPQDGVLEIGRELAGVLSIPGPLQRATGFLTTGIQRESFRVAQMRSQPASTAADDRTTCTFGKGLWRVYLTYSILSNFTQLSDGTQPLTTNTLALVDPSPTVVEMLKGLAVNAVPQHLRATYDLHLFEDSWIIQLRTQATGVGETLTQLVTVIANRLL